jgi:hypothetical protein
MKRAGLAGGARSDGTHLRSNKRMSEIVTLPVAVLVDAFRWQLELFWFGHRQIYGCAALAKAHAVLINRNEMSAVAATRMVWDIDVPHTICRSIYDLPAAMSIHLADTRLALPLNIQIGLEQVLPQLNDDLILEVVDCDMVHFRPCPIRDVRPNELFVSGIYENWHMFSLTDNRYVIEPYFENSGQYYNGGFVPIIGRAATFKRILPEWIAVHIDILNRPLDGNIHWWAGMFALQAACEKARVQMVAQDLCYIPNANDLTSEHYIGHYSVDPVFDKRVYPQIDLLRFPDNPYYNMIKAWITSQCGHAV